MISFTELTSITAAENIRESVPGAELTTFRTGGPVRFVVSPEDTLELTALVSYLRDRKTPYFIVGRGSNLLIADKGYDGVLISLRKYFSDIEVRGTEIYAEAGAMLSEVARAALSAGLTGFEFASGIPGTVGGALYMDAGAYGSEMRNVVKTAEVLLPDGNAKIFTNEELKLSYRKSCLSENEGLVLSVMFSLTPGDPEVIRDTMEDLNRRRREKQPLEFGSAGSTFKRPEGYFAGKLIEDAGMKGYRVGDACVSEKHAGFVVNLGAATTEDVLSVIRAVQDRVFLHAGVRLEPEIRFLS